jgi:hypothetical protein
MAEAQRGVHGEGGAGGGQGRSDDGRAGERLRGSSEPDLNWKKQLLDGAASVFASGGGAAEGTAGEAQSIFCTGRSASRRSKTILWHESSANEPGGTGARWSRARTRHYRYRSNADGWRYPVPQSTAGQPRAARRTERSWLIDRQYLTRPDDGSRRMAAWLATQGHPVNRKRVQRRMRLMGWVAVYRRPNTSNATVPVVWTASAENKLKLVAG